jgi:Zn-dependent alcohol dehydrogenase
VGEQHLAHELAAAANSDLLEHAHGPSLRMLARHRDRLPFDALITDRVALDGVGEALERAQTGAATKILVAPQRRDGGDR